MSPEELYRYQTGEEPFQNGTPTVHYSTWCHYQLSDILNTHPADQEQPPKDQGPIIPDLVIEDLKQRKEDGIKKYGTPLRAYNGRNSLNDLYQEIADALQYTRQAIIEHQYAVDLLNNLHNQLAKQPLESSVYNKLSTQLITIKRLLTVNQI